MKIATLIARILLGLMFLVFGLNGFLHFIPMGPMPAGLAGEFMDAMTKSHYMNVVSALQILGAILLLVNRYVALGLTLLGPVVVNILLFHIFLLPSGLPIAFVAALLWFGAAYRVRSTFAGLFAT